MYIHVPIAIDTRSKIIAIIPTMTTTGVFIPLLFVESPFCFVSRVGVTSVEVTLNMR